MSQKPPIELPPTFVGAQPHSGDSATSVNLRPRPSSEGYVDDDEEAEYVGLMMTVASEAADKDHKEKAASIAGSIDVRVAEAKANNALTGQSVTGSYIEYTTLNDMLMESKEELAREQTNSLGFFGSSPARERGKVTRQINKRLGKGEDPLSVIESWKSSYNSTLSADRLQAKINIIQSRIGPLESIALEAQRQFESEKQRLADESARIANEEQARIATEVEVQRVNDERERIEREEQARDSAEKQLKLATEQGGDLSNSRTDTFTSLVSSVSQAQVIGASGTLAPAEGTKLSLQAAIQGARAALLQAGTGTASGLMIGVAALIYSPKLANGELPQQHGISLPLADLVSTPAPDINAGASSLGSIDMTIRIGSRLVTDDVSEFFVFSADGVNIPTDVRVVAVAFNAGENLYSASIDGVSPKTITWTPSVSPENSSTSLPVEQSESVTYGGASVTPVDTRIDVHPELAEAGYEDYIFVFPSESGLPPLYAVFSSARDLPGIASGLGQPAAEKWLETSREGIGAPIPSEIAEQLKGKLFSNFGKFREAVWKLVAADPVLSGGFSPWNIGLMKKGYSPHVIEGESVGKRDVFEIHHVNFISKGGAVYDIDNLRIMTPKRHIELHSEI